MVQQWLKDELYPFLERLENNEHLPTFVVHLGVDEKCQQIKLENRAFNEAKFRIPDQSGWKPDGIPINGAEKCSYFRETKLPIGNLAAALQKYNVLVSKDAGRYVCNYSYFVSLEEASQREGIFPLFVHVPLFSKVSKERQLEFLGALFQELAMCFDQEEEGKMAIK